MKRKTFVITWTMRKASSGFLLKAGSENRFSYGSALKCAMQIARYRAMEQGLAFNESYRSIQKDAGGFHIIGSKFGYENSNDVRLDFIIELQEVTQ